MVSPASHPRLLGRYALYEKIASGGMASVHIGRLIGPEGFARTVAVKRMHAHFAEDPAFVAMFLDEARVAARIRHPNVVQTLDIVAMEGELFLVMDFVQGESLSRLIATAAARRERIPPAIVATIMVGVLHGLHAAHEAKNERGEPLDVVHRDVSPHNVLVGVDGVARVLDFGVAKAIGRAQTTRDGQLKGKIAYMAPEQIRGNVTRSADVYAASVVLWEALTGMRFITGDNEVQVLERALSGSTEPPSKYAGFVTPALDAVTMRGLAVDPTKRFATAREMARAIEQTIGLATASEVGDWVESTAKTTLDERSARIASIESDSSVQLPAFLAAARSPSLPDGGPPLPAAPARVVSIRDAAETVPTEASASAVSFPSRVGIPGLHGRGTWIAGGAVGALLVVVGVIAMASRSSTSSPAVAAGPPPEPIASPESVAAEPAIPPPPPMLVPLGGSQPTEPSAAAKTTPPPWRPPVRTPGAHPATPAVPGAPGAAPKYNPLDHL